MRKVQQLNFNNIIESFIIKKELLYQLSKTEISDVLTMCSYILSSSVDTNQKSKALTILYDMAYTQEITLEEVWQIYWIITSELFSNEKITLIRGDIFDLYNYIFDSLHEYLNLKYEYRNLEERNQDVIIVLTSQFLSQYHAPTRRVLDYSYAIQKNLGKKVIIINDGGTNTYKSKSLMGTIKMNFVDEYSDYTKITYLGEEFEFFQISSMMPNIDVISELIYEIYKINPLCIYNIGASSLVADLCTDFVTTISLPCSYGIPISRSKYLAVGRKVEEKEYLNRILNYQRIVETTINYQMGNCKIQYERKLFGILEEDFTLSIVGNRLDKELSRDFLSLIDRIVSSFNIHILFIGQINNIDKVKQAVEKKENLHFAGSVLEASELVKLTDLYLNPKRNGGGRSSFEALHYGVPIITLNFGDVYYTAGDEFSVKSYNEIYEMIKRYYEDAEFLKNMRKKAKDRARSLSDIVGTQQRMLNEILLKEIEENGKY